MNIIPLGPDAAARVAAAALNKEVVCLLSDRDITGSGVEVEFFGETTTLPAGPAVMALRTGCRVLPTAVYFEPDATASGAGAAARSTRPRAAGSARTSPGSPRTWPTSSRS